MLLTRPKATREQDRLRKIHRNFYNQLNVLSLIREKFSRLMIVVMVGENFLTARRGKLPNFLSFFIHAILKMLEQKTFWMFYAELLVLKKKLYENFFLIQEFSFSKENF